MTERRCDYLRCWRRADVFVPDLAAYCSSHALIEWGSWPQRRFREIESKNHAAVISPRGAAA